MFKALSRLVPPPAYITMPAAGVDISDATLKYIELKPDLRSDKARIIQGWGEIKIPMGVVSRGVISDPAKLTAVLKEFKEKTGQEYIRVSLPEERAYIFETDIKKGLSVKEVRNLLEFRLEENVPIPAKDVYFDYSFLPADDKREMITVSVVAYPKETIETYYSCCREAGLIPLTFEVEAQSMARAMVPKDVSGAVMIVDCGSARTGIGIVYRDTLMYTSTVDIGGEKLSQVLQKVLGNKSESELNKIKNSIGLIRQADSSDIRDALISTISVIKDELATRMQYWHLENPSSERRINTVYLCGGSSNLKGLPEYLSDTLGVTTKRGNVWENTFSLDEVTPEIDLRHSYGYASAIGLALKNIV